MRLKDYHVMYRALSLPALACAVLAAPAQSEGAEQPLVAYYVISSTVSDVVADLGKEIGLRYELDGRLDGKLTSRHLQGSVESLLANLGQEFGFVYFDYNDVLYVSAITETLTRVVSREGFTSSEIMLLVEKGGLSDAPINLKEIAASNAVIVTGPPAAIALVESLVQTAVAATAVPRKRVVIRRGVEVSN